MPFKICHDIPNERWEIAVTMSEKGFQQVSFVNSIATTKVCRTGPMIYVLLSERIILILSNAKSY